jgi:hypothetical protein
MVSFLAVSGYHSRFVIDGVIFSRPMGTAEEELLVRLTHSG